MVGAGRVGGGGSLALVITKSSCARPLVPERNPQQVGSKFHTDTHHAGKLQGQFLSEPDASISPLFVRLTYFIILH